MNFTLTPAAEKLIRRMLRFGGGKFFLPAESRMRLDGVTIDFAETPIQSALAFHDPKTASRGCRSTASPAADIAIGALSH